MVVLKIIDFCSENHKTRFSTFLIFRCTVSECSHRYVSEFESRCAYKL